MPLGSINRLGGLASNFAEPSGAGPSRTPNVEPSALDPLAVASDRRLPDARFGARAPLPFNVNLITPKTSTPRLAG